MDTIPLFISYTDARVQMWYVIKDKYIMNYK